MQHDITLYTFPTAPGFFSPSPYCTKADILLRLAGIEFKEEIPEDYTTLPKGKLPVMRHGDKIIPDSEFIRLYIEDNLGHDFTAGLSVSENATAHFLCRTIEENMIRILIMSRWVDDEGWAQIKKAFFAEAPDEVANEIRGRVVGYIGAQDIGKHSREEVVTILRRELKAIADTLGDKPFLFGDTPTYADATAFGMIANLYGSMFQTWTRDVVAEYPPLVAYFERGMALWFPNAQQMVA